MTAKTVYIVEQKLSHWTTVEPLIVLFRKRDWNVVVLAPKQFQETAKIYLAVHGQEVGANLVYRNVNRPFSFWPAIFSPPNLTIVSDRYFYPKNLVGRKSLALWVRFLVFFISRWLFLRFVSSRSPLIRTTHFTDLIDFPETAKTGVAFIDRHLTAIWELSVKFTRALNVYSSLVKKHHAAHSKTDILVAPNALYRPQAGHFAVRNYRKRRIIIPGRIDGRRRQYDWIKSLPADLSMRLDIVMVGKTQTPSDLLFLKQIQEKGFGQIVSENAFISFEEFDAQLYSADLLFVPLRKLANPKRAVDRNLGAFFDAVRYGKGILLPADILAPPELKDNLVRYANNEDLFSIMRRLVEDDEYLNEVKNAALDASRNWTLKQYEFMDTVTSFSQE